MLDRWNRLSTPQRGLVLGVALVVAGTAAGVVALARRDLAGRPDHLIRGNADLWRRVTFFPGAAVAYLAIGRKGIGRRRPELEAPASPAQRRAA